MQNLDQHRSFDAATGELRAQVIGREVAREAIADRAGPRIWWSAGPQEMMMRVDNMRPITSVPPRRRPCPATSSSRPVRLAFAHESFDTMPEVVAGIARTHEIVSIR